MTDPRAMSTEELADVVRGVVPDRAHATDYRKYYAACIDEAARRLREHADLEAACGLLGEECRAWRDDTNDSNRDTRLRLGESIDKVNAHPLAAQYVKPKETTDGH